jgi:hypothetical protein
VVVWFACHTLFYLFVLPLLLTILWCLNRAQVTHTRAQG